MSLETGLFFAIFLLIICLLRQQAAHTKIQQRQQQNETLTQLLQAYPVHQYTMPHMLERSLAMIFSIPQCNLSSKGAIFLLKDGKLCFSAQRGLVEDTDSVDSEPSLSSCLCNRSVEIDRFQLISCTNSNQNLPSHDHYIVPLIRANKLLGVLTFQTPKTNKITRKNEVQFIKSLGATLASLIERKQVADELNLASSVLNHSQQAIFITDTNNKIIRCNEACEKITGYSNDELIGQNPRIFQSKYHAEQFYHNLWKQVLDSGFWQGEIWNKRKDQSICPEWLSISAIKDADNNVTQYLAIFTDLSLVKKAEKDIQYLSFFDPLTELPNRTLFIDRAEQAITQANQQNKQFALLCLDIDHFKKVNESLGHGEGDKLLQIFAGRMNQILRKEDSLARIGGDEFAMIIRNLDEKNNQPIIGVVEKILISLKETVHLSGHDFISTASIGISLYPNDANNSSDLITYADIAMFQAKQAGRNNYQFYTEKFNQQALRKIEIESALRLALKDNDFEVYLQGQQRLNSNSLTGAEALLRVKSGELSAMSPAEYIPVAEETGLIVEIGDWVFAEVCRLLGDWSNNNILPDNFNRIAVNISPFQFRRLDFISKIEQCIKETGVDAHLLEIELTESALQEPMFSVIDKLLAIKELGIAIAIDDFGTGYSSLSRLKQFPIDLLKIDRSFVNDICSNQNDTAIVSAIIKMARALGINTLAEGIETKEQALLLKKLNCHFGQGFLFNQPMKVNQFETLLRQSQPLQKISC